MEQYAQTPSVIFRNADAMAEAVFSRCQAISMAGYFDAGAFYMRKILEIVTTSFVDRYDELGMGAAFDSFLSQRGHDRRSATLDDKVDYLLQQGNLPAESRATYDDIRKYGNAAVHKTYFTEDADQHQKLLERLERELVAFHAMVEADAAAAVDFGM